MDRHELDRMFDAMRPDPQRERELLQELLQDEARRKKPMKNWKRLIIGVAAAALLVTATAAAVVPGISRKLLEYLGVVPEDSQTVVDLLLPGSMAVDITKEDNGAVLHVSQVLRDRNYIMALADFTAPEGTVLNMGEQDAPGRWMRKGFSLIDENTACFVDEAGMPVGDGLVSFFEWEVLEDDDPLDNHISFMLIISPDAGAGLTSQSAAAVRIAAENLSYFDGEGFDSEAVYSGDWTVQIPLPQKDIGWTMQVNQVIGELDGETITAEELYLSPMTFELHLRREGILNFVGVPLDEQGEAAYGHWLSIGNNVQRLTLITGDGETIPLEMRVGGGFIGYEEKVVVHRLSEITDPARFQGGTLAIEWDFHASEGSGSATIPLDNLAPVEPQE